MMNNEKEKTVLPGDFLSLPEEFLPGKHAYEREDAVRALLAGHIRRDMPRREIDVMPVVKTHLPSVGDTITGQIEAAQTSTANVKIYYLNGRPTLGGFYGTLFLRQERGGRGMRRTQVKLGDIVRARVGSTMNAVIQLAIDDSHLGVIASLCSTCGKSLNRADGRAKCDQCGAVEERKFADDFGRRSIQP